jgi:transcriptional regulator with GAF, ATPase, and Fis domain
VADPGPRGRTLAEDETREGAVQNRDRLLTRTFVRLADTLVDDFDIVEFLHELCADVVQLVGAETAGVMLADTRGGLRLLASSEERMRILEVFELQSQQGPCLDAFRTHETVAATLEDGARLWPNFTPYAARLGFRYMCAVPLQLRDVTLGALNLFRATDDPFAEADLEIAQAMAKVAATGLLQRRTISEGNLVSGQLQTALQSRIAIEQAKGVLAERLNLSVDEAFQRLRRQARNTNRKLTDLARDVVNKRVDAHTFIAPASPPSPAGAG